MRLSSLSLLVSVFTLVLAKGASKRSKVMGRMWGSNENPLEELHADEVERRLRLLIDMMDTDDDNKVQPKEMHLWILSSLRNQSMEKTLGRFYTVDSNLDEFVSFEETEKSIRTSIPGLHSENSGDKGLEPVDPEVEAYARMRLWHARQLYNLADADQDGRLSPQEYHLYCAPGQYPPALALVSSQLLRERDTNKDGKLSFQEHIKDTGIGSNRYEIQLAERERFDLMDSDEDGFANVEELKTWLTDDLNSVSRRAAVSLLHQTDDNMDGAMSTGELLSYRDTVIRSHATNYGRLITHFPPGAHDEL